MKRLVPHNPTLHSAAERGVIANADGDERLSIAPAFYGRIAGSGHFPIMRFEPCQVRDIPQPAIGKLCRNEQLLPAAIPRSLTSAGSTWIVLAACSLAISPGASSAAALSCCKRSHALRQRSNCQRDGRGATAAMQTRLEIPTCMLQGPAECSTHH
jgi:hypothetical protein